MAGDADTRQQKEDAARDELAIAVGRLICRFNDFQERATEIFGMCFDGNGAETARAVWHAVESDRSQREMLLAASIAGFATRPAILAEIKWTLQMVGNLASARNDAAHAPSAVHFGEHGASAIASPVYDHPRALRLEGVNLVEHLRSASADIEALTAYIGAIYQTAVDASRPLPERPPLQHRGPSATQKAPRRRTGDRSPQRQPRSSQR